MALVFYIFFVISYFCCIFARGMVCAFKIFSVVDELLVDMQGIENVENVF